MDIKPALVKELRERTGAGMMECKKALVETKGDIDAAAEWLRKAGAAKADKKSSRVAAEGRIAIRSDEKAGRHVVLEVNSETDFVAKDDNFRAFVDRLAEVILSQRPANVEALLRSSVAGKTVEDLRLELVTKVGENISVRRFDVVESRGNVGAYVHGTRIGVLVDLEGGDTAFARDIAMQIASLAPRYVTSDEVPKELLDKEREIIAAQTAEEKKPPEILAKMVEGKLRKFIDEITLTGQVFVKDEKGKARVRDVLAQHKAKVQGFRRYEVGEGIEKKSADFAKEVEAIAQGSQSR
ncbi:MAG TPA: translation elongation factor Ts [Gammaproteobacteria bacterium]|nr:translation elongation factor Ts [Gammaproteobacteria bacterium]